MSLRKYPKQPKQTQATASNSVFKFNGIMFIAALRNPKVNHLDIAQIRTYTYRIYFYVPNVKESTESPCIV